MGYLGQDVPKLGFGLMRLPKNGGEIDIEATKMMVDRFLAAGFTYFDTAWGYDNGKSEEAVKPALVDRYPRESFLLATKLPAWAGAKNAAEAKAMLQTSLARTGAGYFDYYLLHNLGGNRSRAFDEFGIWDYVAEMKARGILRHVGFSFHDKAELLDEILAKHPEMEFVQLQINWADWESETVQAKKCYETARAHGKPVIIMEPVKGGLLAEPPETVKKIFRDADANASPADWALRFAASLEGLVTVLSGMSNLRQMEENSALFTHFSPLNETERAVFEKARKTLESLPTIPCTACHYCEKNCPAGVWISDNMAQLNNYHLYYEGDKQKAHANYGWIAGNKGEASRCVACGQCEAVCPQHIPIVENLKKAAEVFE